MLGHFAAVEEPLISKGFKSIGGDLIMPCPCEIQADELPLPRLGMKLSPQLGQCQPLCMYMVLHSLASQIKLHYFISLYLSCLVSLACAHLSIMSLVAVCG
jgi:hypothetical protein